MRILNFLFGKKSESIHNDLSHLKIDVHSHLIPAIDDGSQSMEDTLIMLKEFASIGYTKIITTPHIMGDSYRNTPEIINDGLQSIKDEIQNNYPDLQHLKLEAAAEYYFDTEFLEKIENEKLLTFGNNYVLFELSYLNEPEGILNVIFQLQTKGYKPVLAHPERYPYYHNKINKYKELVDRGVLLQINTNSLVGHYGPQVKLCAEQLINENLISLIGSDCHRLEHLSVLKKIAQSKHLHHLMQSGMLINHTL